MRGECGSFSCNPDASFPRRDYFAVEQSAYGKPARRTYAHVAQLLRARVGHRCRRRGIAGSYRITVASIARSQSERARTGRFGLSAGINCTDQDAPATIDRTALM